MATLENSVSVTEVTVQLPAPKSASKLACKPAVSKRSSVSSVRGCAAVGAAISIAPCVPKPVLGWPEETNVSAPTGWL